MVFFKTIQYFDPQQIKVLPPDESFLDSIGTKRAPIIHFQNNELRDEFVVYREIVEDIKIVSENDCWETAKRLQNFWQAMASRRRADAERSFSKLDNILSPQRQLIRDVKNVHVFVLQ